MSDAAIHPLRSYRQKHGLSQSELADRLDTHTTTIWRIEARQTKPTFDLIRRIMALTNREVTADMLIDAGPADDDRVAAA